MTIGYQIIKLRADGQDDGAELLAKVESALASKAPILFVPENGLPFWATDASISEGTATVHAYMGLSYITLTISSGSVSAVQDVVATTDTNS